MRITKRAVARYAIAILMGGAAAIFAGSLEQAQLQWRYSIGLNYLIYLSSDPPGWSEYLIITTLWALPTAYIACIVAVLVYHFTFKPQSDDVLPLTPQQLHPQGPVQAQVRGGDMSVVRIIRGDMYRVALTGVTVLMVVVGVLWGASFEWSISIRRPRFPRSGPIMSLSFRHGIAHVYYSERYVEPDFRITPYPTNNYNTSPPRFVISPWTGFHMWRNPGGWSMSVPIWSLFAALPIWPTIAAVRWIRTRPRPGYCTACRYDLRGSKGSTNCPECGEAI